MQDNRYFIYNFPLKIRGKGYEVQEKEISYMDFCIRKEHMFLRNTFSKQELNKSKYLENLKTYYDHFKLFYEFVVQLESCTNKYSTFNRIIDSKLIDFCSDYCDEFSNFDEIKN